MSLLVVKVGGAVADETAARAVRDLVAQSHEVCVVHGAGPQITAEMGRRGLVVEFVGGRRVTTEAGLEVVRESLLEFNSALRAEIGPKAVGLAGDEIGLRAEPVPGLGLVGEPLPSRPPIVLAALAAGLVPVVSPLAAGPLNVNADETAAALAIGLEADGLLFVSDVQGLLLDGVVVQAIEADDAEELLDAGSLEGGILPKLRAAVTAARVGVRTEIGETVVHA